MSLTDILGWTGLAVFAAGAFYAVNKYYIPYAKKLQVKYDKEEKECTDDYRFSENKKK